MSGSDGFSNTLYEQLCKEGSAKSTLVLVAVLLFSVILGWVMCRMTEENGWPEDITFFHNEPKRDNKRFKAPRGFNRARPCHTWESDSEISMEFGNLER